MKKHEYKKALIISKLYHEVIKQRRRNENVPYYYHPIRVAKLCYNSGMRDDHTLAAALLHDVVEDTPATLLEIHTLFPSRIVHIVSLLTDTEWPVPVRRADRKRFQLVRMRDCPVYLAETVHTIKLCDLYDNAKSILKHEPDFAKVFMKEYLDLFEALDKAKPSIRRLCEQQLNEYFTVQE